VVLVIALTVYCLVNCLQAEDGAVRTLPKWAWVLLVVVLPLVGGVAYLLAGRPLPSTGGPGRARNRPPQGPDDDDDFLRRL